MKTSIINKQNNVVGEVDLPDNIFNKEINMSLLKEVIVFYQQPNNRQGTASTKNRSTVNGSKRKMRPQKKSGRARMGAKNAVHHRGGSVAFGPNGRLYNPKMTAKKMQLALLMTLSDKAKNGNLVVMDDMKMNEIKTKNFVQMTNNLNLNKGTLFIDNEKDNNFFLSMRNVIGFDFLKSCGLNPLSIVKAKKIIVSLETINYLRTRYA